MRIDPRPTAPYNALVQGGRCCNENPYEYEIGAGLDVDISGCYGESLRSLVYPVGLPSVWAFTPNQQRTTLGAWLDRYEADLVPGLWAAVVSGKLGFEQDIVFSKMATPADIKKAVGPTRDDDSDINSDFAMLRTEIVNGVITADVLKVLKAVATNAEWSALRNLELVTATAYLSNDRKADVRAWCESVLADSGNVQIRNHTTTDTRTRAWYGVELESFVGKLVDRRHEQKKISKAGGPDASRAAGLDTMLKLLVNTLYGVMASRYFSVGNVTVANVITARARAGVWMLSKALGCRQSITDGGIYTPDAVPLFNPERARPGLETLSRSWEWADQPRGRKFVRMGGRKWADNLHEMPPGVALDEMATVHIQEFWTPYNLDFTFRIEHKVENTFRRAAYWSKADYALERLDGKIVYAVRGKDKNKRTDRKLHPTFTLLDAILVGADTFPADLEYTRGGILKVGKYQVVQSCNGYEDWKNLRPGDSLPNETYTARYNNTHFPMMDADEYHRRRYRKKYHRGNDVRWFEKFATRGISGVHEGMIRDRL